MVPRLALTVAGALALAAMVGPAAAESATTHTKTYSTPGVYTFTVPANVVSVTAHVVGAAGGDCSPFVSVDPDAGNGGQGAAATATLAVKPGAKLLVGVGGTGGVCTPGPAIESPVAAVTPAVTGGGGSGGLNGGAAGGPTPGAFGASGAGGGGASGVLASVTSPLVVAGGGGGGAYCGGNGGNADSAGTSGQTDCEGTDSAGGGGGAGTVSAGGAGGAAGDANASPGDAGTTENGGAGGAGAPFGSYSGGGGGGGLNGGGGGGGGDEAYGGGGGGGGASFVLPAATKISAPSPTTAPAEVIITYKAASRPKATTHQATAVRQTSCTLHGTVNGEGLKTTYWFQWGAAKSYRHKTGSHKTGGKSKSVSALINHLKAGTTYHFRVVAKTLSGTAHGQDMTCTTPKAKVKPVFTG
jgi:hypothetical protein